MANKTDYGPGNSQDPFPTYATNDELASGDFGDAAAAVSDHENAEDPHPNYKLSTAEATDLDDLHDDITGETTATVAVHASDTDPHPGQYDLDGASADAVDTHNVDNAAHGIADVSALETTTGSQDKVDVHAMDTDPHGDRAYADTDVSDHVADTDPHGDQAYTDTSVSDHAVDTDPHGDRAYADSIASGLVVKDSVRAATTANITLSGAQTIDGVAVVAGNRVLVKNQTTKHDNGIYDAASGSWSRSTDADANDEVTAGMFTYVSEGTTQATTSWVLNVTGAVTLGSTDLTFGQFSATGAVAAGAGLLKTGNTIDLVSSDNSLTITSDNAVVAANHGGSTHASLQAYADADITTHNSGNHHYSYGPVFKIDDYSAAGNGTTDDTAAVQAAVDAMPSTGGVLVLGNGKTYKLTATSKTITGATYDSGNKQITFTSSSHGYVANDVVNVISVTPSTFNGSFLVRSVTSNTLTVDRDNTPGTYTSGGAAVGTGVYIRDKAGVVVTTLGSRSQGTAGGAWFKVGTAGMTCLAVQKTPNSTAMTHSGPTIENVGFIRTEVDANNNTGASAAWAAGTVTVTKAGHGFSTGDVVAITNATDLDYNGSYTVTVTSSSVFTYALASDPGTSPVTCSISYETFTGSGATKKPSGVGIAIVGCTRWYAERNMFSGLHYGILLQTANSKDTSWGKGHANVWQMCDVGFKIIGDGGQSVYFDGGNLIMHTAQIGFQGPNPEETSNDANHFRCTGMKFDTQYTTGAGCMGFDLGNAKYFYIGHHSFEMEGTSTTRCIRVGSVKQSYGTIVGINAQHNDGRAGTAIEILGTAANNAATVHVVGGHYTNWNTAVKIGPYSQGSTVDGGSVTVSGSGCSGVVVDSTGVTGTVINGFTATPSSTFTLLSIPSGSDTRWSNCWTGGNGTPVWNHSSRLQTKAGAPSNTPGVEFPVLVDGLMQLDTTAGKLYVRTGGAWKSATLA